MVVTPEWRHDIRFVHWGVAVKADLQVSNQGGNCVLSTRFVAFASSLGSEDILVAVDFEVDKEGGGLGDCTTTMVTTLRHVTGINWEIQISNNLF